MTVILNVKLKVLLNVMNHQLHLAQTHLRLENRRLLLACLYVLYSQLRLDNRQLQGLNYFEKSAFLTDRQVNKSAFPSKYLPI